MNKRKTRTWKVIWIAANDDVLSEQKIQCLGDLRDALREFITQAITERWRVKSIEHIYPVGNELSGNTDLL